MNKSFTQIKEFVNNAWSYLTILLEIEKVGGVYKITNSTTINGTSYKFPFEGNILKIRYKPNVKITSENQSEADTYY